MITEKFFKKVLKSSENELIKLYQYHKDRDEAEGYTEFIRKELRNRRIPKSKYNK